MKEVSVKNPFEIRLDSRANLDNWRRRLDREEVDLDLVGNAGRS